MRDSGVLILYDLMFQHLLIIHCWNVVDQFIEVHVGLDKMRFCLIDQFYP